MGDHGARLGVTERAVVAAVASPARRAAPGPRAAPALRAGLASPALARRCPAPAPAIPAGELSRCREAEPEEAPPESELPPLAETEDSLVSTVFGAGGGALSIDLRVERFLGWIMGSTGAFAAFLADQEGLPLANRNTPDSFVAAAAPLARVQSSVDALVPTPGAGSQIVELEQQNVLHMIWADTSAGQVGVGLVLAAPLDRKLVIRVRRMTALALGVPGRS